MRRRFVPVLLFSLVMTLAVLTGLATHIKNATFPFVELEVVRTVEKFNAPPSESPISYEVPALKVEPVPDAPNKEYAIAWSVRMRLYPKEGTILDSPDDVKEGRQLPAVCSEYAKLAVSVAAGMDIQGRVVWLSGHTVSEIWRKDLGKWVLVDTYGDQMYLSGNQTPLSVVELVSGEGAVSHPVIRGFVIICIYDPEFGQESRRLYCLTDICVVIEGPRLYDFHRRNWDPGVILGYIFGGEPVARGIQFVPEGKEPPAGSVIWTVRILLGLLALLWIATLIWGVYCAATRPRRTTPSPS